MIKDLSIKLDNHLPRSNNYQYLVVALCFTLWANIDLLLIMIPFLELMPTVTQFNTDSLEFEGTSLNYTICEKEHYRLFNNAHSWVTQFDIECDKVAVSLIASFAFFGNLMGALLYSLIADSLGRKKTFVVFTLIYALTLGLFILAPSIKLIYLCQFVGGGSAAVLLCNTSVYVSETIQQSARSAVFGVINAGFACCALIYVLTIWYTQNWQFTFLLAALLSLFTGLLIHFLLVESPKYYLVKGNLMMFIDSHRQIAKFNGDLDRFDRCIGYPNCIYSTETEQILDVPLLNETGVVGEESKGPTFDVRSLAHKYSKPKGNTFFLAWKLISYKSQRFNFLATICCYGIISASYYGFSIYIKKLPGNTYMNGIMIYFFEILSYVGLSQITNVPWIGRKYGAMFYLAVTISLYAVLYLFSLNEISAMITGVACRLSLSAAYTISVIWFLELFPNELRASAAGCQKMTGKLGGIATPFIIEMVPEHSNLVYCLFLAVGLVLFACMEETFGKSLPTTIPEEDKVSI